MHGHKSRRTRTIDVKEKKLLHTRSTINSLVVEPQWELDSMQSCCSAMVLRRLRGGDYFTEVEYQRAITQAVADEAGRIAVPTQIEYLGEDEMMDPETALPVWVVFSGVLADMLTHAGATQRRMFIWTDNISRPPTGDVHKGALSPRKFFDWLHANDLMNCTEHLHYPVASYTCDFKGKLTKTRAMIKKGTTEMKRRYKKVNDRLPNNGAQRGWWNDTRY